MFKTRSTHPITDWSETPAFAIFHQAAALNYLIFCWWGNDNELFNIVSIEQDNRWTVNPSGYSFCIWDLAHFSLHLSRTGNAEPQLGPRNLVPDQTKNALEVIWHERNSFIRHLYSGSQDIASYRTDFIRIEAGT